jgi:SAM-dependent MidA family methyltransferase
MAEALYGPDGYYTRRPRLGGAGADFFTSPELHPAFGALIGRFARGVWHALDRPSRFDLVEHGPGSGALARDLLTWARAAPDFAESLHSCLVETSAPLREAQRETLAAAGLLDERVAWAEGGRHTGLVLANELVDALPTHVVVVRGGAVRERYVALDSERLTWIEDAPSTPALAAYFGRLGLLPGEGCIAEVNLAGLDWIEEASATLERGALLVLDYGYPALDLYSPTRRYGTLLTYYAHTLGSDPLVRVGEQDITAHVDFTSLARAGEQAGLQTVGLISQAAFLRRLGLDGYLRRLDGSALSAWDHDANRRALLALTDPEGLGRVQAFLQTRGLPDFDLFPAAEDDWLPLLRPGQMRLPGPLEAEGFVNLKGQWRELFGDEDEQDD